jgi:thiol-disulfide isomerase/thioredoxin
MMKMYREPLLDAFLSEKEWFDSYKKEFFNVVDFSNPELVNTSVYTEKAIQFIQSYARRDLTREQQEHEFTRAAETLMNHVKVYQVTSDLLLDYMMKGFEQLGLQKTLEFLAKNYSVSTCNPDEITTLERRLGFQNMMPGNIAPDFTLNDQKGNPIELLNIVNGKTLLLFWASWCPHCSVIISELKKYASTPGFGVVAVSIDTTKADWLAKINESGISGWIHLSDLKGWDSEAARKYNVYATPTMFIIDSGLKILSKPTTVDEAIRLMTEK